MKGGIAMVIIDPNASDEDDEASERKDQTGEEFRDDWETRIKDDKEGQEIPEYDWSKGQQRK